MKRFESWGGGLVKREAQFEASTSGDKSTPSTKLEKAES